MTQIRSVLLIAAATLAFLSPPALAQGSRTEQGPAVKLLSYDFETEVKTTILVDGTILEETFNPADLRRVVGRVGAKGVTTSKAEAE